MPSMRATETSDGIIGLVRETADGLGRLVADHIKLARLEIVADAKGYARETAVLLVGALILLVGYGFAWLAIALTLATWLGAPIAFGCVAALHLAAGGVALGAATRRMKRARLMGETASEVSRSVSALARTTTPVPVGQHEEAAPGRGFSNGAHARPEAAGLGSAQSIRGHAERPGVASPVNK